MTCSMSLIEPVRLLAGMASALTRSNGSAAATAGTTITFRNVRRSTVPIARPSYLEYRLETKPPHANRATLTQGVEWSSASRCLGGRCQNRLVSDESASPVRRQLVRQSAHTLSPLY